ncbi:MAG TPA: hypothetical protein VE090_06480 [Methylomirabilota bacterium]|nr:hypothetical protein [Methylomirabilota bacterium]
MSNRQKTTGLRSQFKRFLLGAKKGKKGLLSFFVEKRQKFVISTIVLSLGLFLTEFQFSKSGFSIVFLLAIITNLFLLWAIFEDVKENRAYQTLILPFFYSLAFGLFYFLTPTFFFSKIILTIIYALGLYSLFLSQNILVVSSMRTIALLSGARIVSFVITLISYFFLTNIVFSLHVTVLLVILFIILYTYFLVYCSLWTYNLQKTVSSIVTWAAVLTVCLGEAATILWFWPSTPTIIALFLTGFFYTMVGLSHIWFERRLFKGILWEYVWVSCVTFFLLILFTPWGK